jgi:L,D-transpeptidase ErfK/SrfK
LPNRYFAYEIGCPIRAKGLTASSLIIPARMKNVFTKPCLYACVPGLLLAFGSARLCADFFERPPEGIDVVGVESVAFATDSDTLADIARRYNVGHQEIRIANPDVDFWLPGEGTRVTIPSRYILPRAERMGFVLNLPEMRLYYFPRNRDPERPGVMITHPVSIGRQDWATPLGTTRITTKVRNPSWVPPESIHREHAEMGETLPRVVPPGPDNPLGEYALKLALEGYLLHGTNKPYGVGMRVTHGCIRLYPEDIEALFDSVDVGTAVEFVDQPVKVGWGEDGLYIEVHPLLEEDDRTTEDLMNIALELLEVTAGDGAGRISGEKLALAIEEQSGRPVWLAGRLEQSPAL